MQLFEVFCSILLVYLVFMLGLGFLRWLFDNPSVLIGAFYILIGMAWLLGLSPREGTPGWLLFGVGKFCAYGIPVWLGLKWLGSRAEQRRRRTQTEVAKPKTLTDEELRLRMDAAVAAHRANTLKSRGRLSA